MRLILLCVAMRNFVLRSSSYEKPEAFRLAQDKGRRGVVMRKTVLHLFMLLMLTGPAEVPPFAVPIRMRVPG